MMVMIMIDNDLIPLLSYLDIRTNRRTCRLAEGRCVLLAAGVRGAKAGARRKSLWVKLALGAAQITQIVLTLIMAAQRQPGAAGVAVQPQ